MQNDDPLPLKLAVNLTPYGTLIHIPAYWSFDPKRDMVYARQQTVPSAVRPAQGSAHSRATALPRPFHRRLQEVQPLADRRTAGCLHCCGVEGAEPSVAGSVRSPDRPAVPGSAIEAPRIVSSASAWLPMGCAETFVVRLPDDYHQAARDAFALRPLTACGPRRSLAVVPPLANRRYYGETPRRLRRDCRPIRGNGPGGWRWVRGQRLASWGSQPGLELSIETPATGKGARPMRSLATDATGRQPFPRA